MIHTYTCINDTYIHTYMYKWYIIHISYKAHIYIYTGTDTHTHVIRHIFQYDCFNVSYTSTGRWNDRPGDSSRSQSRAKAGIPWYLDGSGVGWWSFLSFPPRKLGQWWSFLGIWGDYIYISPTTNLRASETAIEWVLVKEDVFFQGRKAYVQSKVTFESMIFRFPFGGICYSSLGVMIAVPVLKRFYG